MADLQRTAAGHRRGCSARIDLIPPGWAKGDLRHGLQAISARMHGWPIGDCETNMAPGWMHALTDHEVERSSGVSEGFGSPWVAIGWPPSGGCAIMTLIICHC